MSESDEQRQQRLSLAYQKHKQRQSAPAAIKRQVMQRARAENQTGWQQSGRNLMTLVGLAMSCAFLAVLSFQYWLPEPTHSTSSLRLVELHTLAPAPNEPQYAKQVSYQQYRAEYLQKQALSMQVQQLARLTIKQDGSWQLARCDNKQLHLSKDLVAMLEQQKRLQASLHNGISVAYSTSAKGLITQIVALDEPLMCS